MNKCLNIPCQWWWCQTNNSCLQDHLSCRRKIVDISKNEVLPSRKNTSKIDQFNKTELQRNINSNKVIRCSNIYCGTTEGITNHHLYPRPHRDGIKGLNKTIPLCWPCHQRVHKLRSNTQLALHYNTKGKVLELLAQDVNYRVMRILTVGTQYNISAMVA